MIRLDENYSDYTVTDDPNYPAGKAQNCSSSETPDGTPILAELVNDIMGSRQAIYKEAFGSTDGINGDPDNISRSDLLLALKYLIETPDAAHAALRGEAAHGATVAADPGQIIARSEYGTAQISDPIEDEDITNKAYVDTEIAGLSDRIDDAETSLDILKANQFGNGTAEVSSNVISVSLTNFPDVTSLEEGARFRVVFNADYAYDGQPSMKVNGGTEKPVTVGNVSAGIGAFQMGKSYEFVYADGSYDCLSRAYSDDYSETEINTGRKWTDGKWIYKCTHNLMDTTKWTRDNVNFTSKTTLGIETLISNSAITDNSILTSFSAGTPGANYDTGIRYRGNNAFSINNSGTGRFIGNICILTIEYTKI